MRAFAGLLLSALFNDSHVSASVWVSLLQEAIGAAVCPSSEQLVCLAA